MVRSTFASLTALLISTSALAQTAIVTDGTLGVEADLGRGGVIIGAELGRTAGGNLFHSFSQFSIGAGDSATFDGPDGLDHVIARVTGGMASRIDGLLRSTVAGADLWLVNPEGIVFGPGSGIDVTAGFHASTADHLILGDDALFSASNPDASILSMAPPESFGFLGNRPGEIVLRGSVLEVAERQKLSLVAGDIRLEPFPNETGANGEAVARYRQAMRRAVLKAVSALMPAGSPSMAKPWRLSARASAAKASMVVMPVP